MNKQAEIVAEIRKVCRTVDHVSHIGWFFVFRGRHFVYVDGRDDVMRICIPHLMKADECSTEKLTKAINETNRNVKFIKTVVLGCGSVSLDYDHKVGANDDISVIVPHAIKALDFAADYFISKLDRV